MYVLLVHVLDHATAYAESAVLIKQLYAEHGERQGSGDQNAAASEPGSDSDSEDVDSYNSETATAMRGSSNADLSEEESVSSSDVQYTTESFGSVASTASDSNSSSRSDASSRPLTPVALNSSATGNVGTGTLKAAANNEVTTNAVASMMSGSSFGGVFIGRLPKAPISKVDSLPICSELTGNQSYFREHSRTSSVLSAADVPTNIPNGRGGSAMSSAAMSGLSQTSNTLQPSVEPSFIDSMMRTSTDAQGVASTTFHTPKSSLSTEPVFQTPQGSFASEGCVPHVQGSESIHHNRRSSSGNSGFGTPAHARSGSVLSVASGKSVGGSSMSQAGQRGSHFGKPPLHSGVPRAPGPWHSRSASSDMRGGGSGMAAWDLDTGSSAIGQEVDLQAAATEAKKVRLAPWQHYEHSGKDWAVPPTREKCLCVDFVRYIFHES